MFCFALIRCWFFPCSSVAKVFQFRVVICSVSLAWTLSLHCCIWWPKEYAHNYWHGWKVIF